jgi:Ser/Thr protein kinase RdoA (MazF antagonist)
VPTLFSTSDGATFVRYQDRLWELTEWMPGTADFHAAPGATRLSQTCEAVARLQQAWNPSAPPIAQCPAIQRRLRRCREWLDLVATGWRPAFTNSLDPVDEPSRRAWSLLGLWASRVPILLKAWATRTFPLQPCLCDIWHDHVLFEGDRVSGIIDFASMKWDHVAVDLARLLGSMVGDDSAMWEVGLRAYRAVRSLSEDEETLSRVLDRTGTILAMANWMRWLYVDGRAFDNRREVARRLRALADRVERWE